MYAIQTMMGPMLPHQFQSPSTDNSNKAQEQEAPAKEPVDSVEISDPHASYTPIGYLGPFGLVVPNHP